MRRTACVDIAALALQIVLRREPDWRPLPVAIVDSDRPRGRILELNEIARSLGILPGMRFAAALSLARSLRACEVPAWEIEGAVHAVVERLRRYAPGIEPARGVSGSAAPGIFWLDAGGLDRLYASLAEWAHQIRDDLAAHERLDARVIVGFRKFATCALARSRFYPVRVLRDEADESAELRRVPIERLGLDPKTRDALMKLGVKTAGEFIDLHPEGIEKRFGRAVRDLHREARGELAVPLEAAAEEPVFRAALHLDYGEADALRLVALVEELLAPLIDRLEAKDLAVREVRITLTLESRDRLVETLRPAAPTTDRRQMIELVQLRLEAACLPDRVSDVEVALEPARRERRQLDLFASAPQRDLAAASRALARIRAELGDDAVVRARSEDGHLPEARFAWEPVETIAPPEPARIITPLLVRRLYHRPLVLPPRPRHEPDGWMLRGLEQGAVQRVFGPYLISGGWWQRAVWREYHYAETENGEIFWVYYDRTRRRWAIQGRVE